MDSDNQQLNPSALTIKDVARLLTKVGGRVVNASMVEADIDAGAPTNSDGTLNLVHYAAWMNKEGKYEHGSSPA